MYIHINIRRVLKLYVPNSLSHKTCNDLASGILTIFYIRHTNVLLTYLITYLLTPWNRVLLERLTDFQLVQKFPAFYGTRKFITTFTSARHLSLS